VRERGETEPRTDVPFLPFRPSRPRLAGRRGDGQMRAGRVAARPISGATSRSKEDARRGESGGRVICTACTPRQGSPAGDTVDMYPAQTAGRQDCDPDRLHTAAHWGGDGGGSARSRALRNQRRTEQIGRGWWPGPESAPARAALCAVRGMQEKTFRSVPCSMHGRVIVAPRSPRQSDCSLLAARCSPTAHRPPPTACTPPTHTASCGVPTEHGGTILKTAASRQSKADDASPALVRSRAHSHARARDVIAFACFLSCTVAAAGGGAVCVCGVSARRENKRSPRTEERRTWEKRSAGTLRASSSSSSARAGVAGGCAGAGRRTQRWTAGGSMNRRTPQKQASHAGTSQPSMRPGNANSASATTGGWWMGRPFGPCRRLLATLAAALPPRRACNEQTKNKALPPQGRHHAPSLARPRARAHRANLISSSAARTGRMDGQPRMHDSDLARSPTFLISRCRYVMPALRLRSIFPSSRAYRPRGGGWRRCCCWWPSHLCIYLVRVSQPASQPDRTGHNLTPHPRLFSRRLCEQPARSRIGDRQG